MKYRVIVEGEYLIALSDLKLGLPAGRQALPTGRQGLRKLTDKERKLIRGLYDLSESDAQIISDIETRGYKNIKATDHDVKAVEYFLKDKLAKTSLKDCLEWIHFALTSEDTNNLAYGLMFAEAIEKGISPVMTQLITAIEKLAKDHADLPMLSRTHGQPASPTTFGKEFRVFSHRLSRQAQQIKSHKLLVKLNGATGNYNAHLAAYPKIDWLKFTKQFINQLNTNILKNYGVKLEANLLTTQIESHDSIAELFDAMRRFNTILLGFNQDMWRYISDGWLGQKAKEGEVGSSTMPHKINPIKFENSEGNLGIANALFTHFSQKLPIARLQRDLSDSTVQRSIGSAFAHSLIAYTYTLNGLSRVAVNSEKVTTALLEHPEVLAEAIQTVLRREGVPMPYEQLKALTRGKEVTMSDLTQFIEGLSVSTKVKSELKKLTPKNYIGLAKKLAQ